MRDAFAPHTSDARASAAGLDAVFKVAVEESGWFMIRGRTRIVKRHRRVVRGAESASPLTAAEERTSPEVRDAPEPDVRAPLLTARAWGRPIVIKAGDIRREAQHGILGGSRQDGQPGRNPDPSVVGGRSDCGLILAHARDDKRSDCDSIPTRARVR